MIDLMLQYILIVLGVCGAFGFFTKYNIDKHKKKKLSKKKLKELEADGK